MNYFILNKELKTVAIAQTDSSSRNAFHVLEDSFVEYSNAPSTLDLTLDFYNEKALEVKDGAHIVFEYDGAYRLFQIKQVDELHAADSYVKVYAEESSFELLDAVIFPKDYENQSAEYLLNICLADTDWEVGEVAEVNVQKHSFASYGTALNEVQTLATETECMLQFRIKFSPQKGVTGKYVDLLEKTNVDEGKRLEFGRNVDSVQRTVDRTTVCTAVIPIGTNDILVNGFDWVNYYNDKSITKVKQNYYLSVDEETRNSINPNSDHHLFYPLIVDSDDKSTLCQKAYEHLKNHKEPKITYDVKAVMLNGVHYKIGEQVKIIDDELGISLVAEVEQQTLSFCDPDKNEIVLTNYVEKQSHISQKLLDLQNKLQTKPLDNPLIVVSPDKPLIEQVGGEGTVWIDTSLSSKDGIVILNKYDTTKGEWLQIQETPSVEQVETVVGEVRVYAEIMAQGRELAILKGDTFPTEGMVEGQLFIHTGENETLYRWNGTEWVKIGASQDSVDAMQKELDDAKEYMEGVKEELEGAKSELTNAKEDLAQTKADLQKTKEDLAQAKEDLLGMEEEITNELTGKVNVVQGEVNTLKEKAEDLQDQADELKSQTQGLQGSMTNINTEIDEINGQLDLVATKTEVQNLVDGIEIGGRNLIINSDVKIGGNTVSPNNYTVISIFHNLLTPLKANKTYTFSSDVEILEGNPTHISVRPFAWYNNANAMDMGIYPNGINAEIIDNHIEITFSIKEHDTYIANNLLVYHGVLGETQGNLINLFNYKLEEGNKATDWTPAPEDVDAKIDTVSTNLSTTNSNLVNVTNRVTTNEANISANAAEISTKLNQTQVETITTTAVNNLDTKVSAEIDETNTNLANTNAALNATNANVVSVTERVTKNEADIKLNAEEISTKMNQTQVENISQNAASNAVNNLQIGGRNLIIANKVQKGKWLNSDGSLADYANMYVTDFIDVKSNQDYVLQLVYVSPTSSRICEYDANGNLIKQTSNTDKYEHYITTSSTTAKVRIGFKTSTGNIEGVKFEIGNKPTAYTPAPEDIESEVALVTKRVTSAESQITQHADLIATKVTATQVETISTGIANNAVNNLQIGGRNLAIYSEMGKYLGGRLNARPTNYTIEGSKMVATNNPSSSLFGFKIVTNGNTTFTASGLARVYDDSGIETNVKLYYTCYDENDTIVKTQAYVTHDTKTDGAFEITLTNIPTTATYIIIGIGHDFLNYNYYVDRFMFEVGNKATDYKPAPEDTEAQINSVSQRVTSNTSAIEQHADLIATKVTQTEIDTAIDNLQIGGRNLLEKTSDEWEEIPVSRWSGNPTYYINGTTGHSQRRLFSELGLNVGDYYTISVDIQSTTKPLGIRVDYYSDLTGGTLKRNNSYLAQNTGINRFVNAGETGRVQYTLQVEEGYPYFILYIGNVDSDAYTESTTEHYKCLKLEKGNKATDWTPAPEDTQSQLDAQGTRITNAESTIEQHADMIASKVDQTTYETDIAGFETRISDAESTVTQTANSIESVVKEKVTEEVQAQAGDIKDEILGQVNSDYTEFQTRLSEAESKIDQKADSVTLTTTKQELLSNIQNIEIGGRNYMLDSENVAKSATPNWQNTYNFSDRFIQDIRGKEITISAYIEADNIAVDTSASSPHFGVDFRINYADGTVLWSNFARGYIIKYDEYTSGTFGGKRYVHTLQVEDKEITSVSNTIVFIRGHLPQGTFTIKDIMIEIGNKASTYVPAPEDAENYIDEQITDTKAELKVTTDAITANVSKNATAITNLQSTTSSMQTNITQNASDIALRATKTEMTESINSAIDDIEVGGRNLIVKNTMLKGYINSTSGNHTSVDDGYNFATDWIDVSDYDTLTITFYDTIENAGGYSGWYHFYDENKTWIKAVKWSPLEPATKTFTNEGHYMRLSLLFGSTLRYKLEGGNKSTAYTPAPEDTDARIESAEASIQLNADNIALNVQAINTANGNISKNTTAIQQNAGEIALRATKTEMTDAINNIEIGGRNLLKNTKDKFFITQSDYGAKLTIYSDKQQVDVVTAGNANIYRFVQSWYTIPFEEMMIVDEPYSYSIEVKAVSGSFTSLWSACDIRSSNGKIMDVRTYDDTASKCTGTGKISLTPADGWVRITGTGLILKKDTVSGALVRIDWGGSEAGSVLVWRNAKLEKGTKATAWTEAPEDVTAYTDSQITQTKSEFKVTTDAITSNVSKNTTAITGLQSTTSSMQTAITQNASDIALRATKTEMTEAIGNIEVGGRNFILESDSNFVESTEEETATEQIYFMLSPELRNNPKLIEGKELTYSFDYEYENVTDKSGRFGLEFTYTTDSSTSTNWAGKWIGNDEDKAKWMEGTSGKGRFSHTLSNFVNVTDMRSISSNIGLHIQMPSGRIKLSKPQLELGNKATQWKAAPEDMDTRVATAEAAIELNAENIALTVESIEGINGTLTSHNTAINQNKSDIALSATKTEAQNYATTAVNNLQIGGRNLLLNSANIYDGSCANGITKTIDTTNGYTKVVTTSDNENWMSFRFGKAYTVAEAELQEGDTFTFSCAIKSDDSTKKPTIYIKSGMGYYTMQGAVSTNWSRLYYTGTWKDANNITFHFGWVGIAGTFYVKEFKLEKGNKPTAWTAAPEDTSERITTAEAAIQVNAEGISQRATKTELTTAINNIQIGGRNYMLDSANKALNTTGVTAKAFDFSSDFINDVKGKQVTISAYIEGKGLVQDTNYHFGIDFQLVYSDGTYTWSDSTKDRLLVVGTDEKIAQSGDIKGQRYYRTITVKDLNIIAINTRSVFIRGYTFTSFIIKDIKIEVGNKPSAWTPAPEDTDNRLLSVEEAAFDVLPNQISSKVSQTTYDNYTAATATQLGTMQSAINQNAKDITAKVESTDYNSMLIADNVVGLTLNTHFTDHPATMTGNTFKTESIKGRTLVNLSPVKVDGTGYYVKDISATYFNEFNEHPFPYNNTANATYGYCPLVAGRTYTMKYEQARKNVDGSTTMYGTLIFQTAAGYAGGTYYEFSCTVGKSLVFTVPDGTIYWTIRGLRQNTAYTYAGNGYRYTILEGDQSDIIDSLPYFEGIYSAGQDKDIEIKSMHKNLFNLRDFVNWQNSLEFANAKNYQITLDENGWMNANPIGTYMGKGCAIYQIPFEEGKRYTISYKGRMVTANADVGATANMTGIRFIYANRDAGGASIQNTVNWQTISTTSTAGVTPIGITLAYSHGNNAIYRDIQIEEGTTATAYEPYQPLTASVPNTVLAGLPDGTCDEITSENKLIKRVGTIVLDGSQGFTKGADEFTNANVTTFYGNVLPNNTGVTHNLNQIQCDKLPVYTHATGMTAPYLGVMARMNFIILCVPTILLPTNDAAGLSTFLANNPITVNYKLGDLEDESDCVLPATHSFDDGCIYMDNIVHPIVEVSYPKNLKSWMEAMEGASNAAGGSITEIGGQLVNFESRIASAEIKLTDESITSTVLTSEAFSSATQDYVVSDDIKGLASTDDVTAAVNGIPFDSKIDQRIAEQLANDASDLNSRLAKKTELQQTDEKFTMAFSQSGGINLIKNSLGFNGVNDGNWICGQPNLTSKGNTNTLTNISVTQWSGTFGLVGVHYSELGLKAGDWINYSVYLKAINRPLRVRLDLATAASGGTYKSTYGNSIAIGAEGVSQLTVQVDDTNPYINCYIANADTTNYTTTTTEQYKNVMIQFGKSYSQPYRAKSHDNSMYFVCGYDPDAEQLGFESVITLTGSPYYERLWQSFPTIVGQTYTVSYYIKQTTATTAQVEVRDYDFNSTALGSKTETVATDGYVFRSFNFVATTSISHLRFYASGNADVSLAGLMVNIGAMPFAHMFAKGEVYNTNISFDMNGIKVIQLDSNGNNIGYTMISPDEFAGYYDTDGDGTFEKIFYLNQDAVVSKRSVAQKEIIMGKLKFINMDDDTYKGWALIPSTVNDWNLSEDTEQ